MKFRRIILNAVKGKSVVQTFNKGDMKNPVKEVVYAMPTLPALTYFYMQFIMGDFLWEKYPKYIKGTIKSSKVKDVFYYDKLEDIVIRSSPYCGGEKWRFHKKSPKVVLPERKKHLVLKKVEVENSDTCGEADRGSRKIIDVRQFRQINKEVVGHKKQVSLLRKELHGTGEAKIQRISTADHSGEQTLKVAVECSRRPKLKRR